MSKQVPEGWNATKLGEVGKFSKGKGIAKKDVISNGLPCIRYAEIYTKHNIVIKTFESFISSELARVSKKIKKNDIIFAGSGETVEDIGKSVTYINSNDAYVGGDAVVFTPSIKMETIFLSYQLNDAVRRIQLRKLGQGSSVIHIYASGLEEIKVNLPSFSEQQKIASILTSVDAVIEKTESQINKLQDLKKGMMQELLTKGIGNTEFKDSPLGRIPKEWKVMLGKDLLELGSGLSPSTITFTDNGDTLFMKVNDFNHAENSDLIRVTKLSFDTLENPKVPVYKEGTVVIAKRGAAISKNRIRVFEKPTSVDTNLMTIVPNKIYNSRFLRHYLELFNVEKIADTTSVPQINNFHLYEMLFPVPPISEQVKIAIKIDSAQTRIDIVKQKLSAQKDIKKALMQDLLTGKVRVITN